MSKCINIIYIYKCNINVMFLDFFFLHLNNNLIFENNEKTEREKR